MPRNPEGRKGVSLRARRSSKAAFKPTIQQDGILPVRNAAGSGRITGTSVVVRRNQMAWFPSGHSAQAGSQSYRRPVQFQIPLYGIVPAKRRARSDAPLDACSLVLRLRPDSFQPGPGRAGPRTIIRARLAERRLTSGRAHLRECIVSARVYQSTTDPSFRSNVSRLRQS